MADYTTSEHARLLLAEATVLLQNPSEDRSESLYDAIALAVEQANVADLIARLACTAAEGWARFGDTAKLTPLEIVQLVVTNWAAAEEAVSSAQ